MPRSMGVTQYAALVVGALLLLAGCGPDVTTTTSSNTEQVTTTTSSNTEQAGLEIPASRDLAVVGDWGSGTTTQDRVAAAMRTRAGELDFGAIVTTGDNLYSNGARELMEPFDWALNSEIPFVISWGNHDIESEDRIEALNDTFADPPRWVLHEWGDIDLVVLDSNQIESPEQIEFLTRTLESSDDPTIVVFHHPPYSCGVHGDTRAVIDKWVPLFDGDVFLVLNGHEHIYQRFEIDRVTYVVTGGGGAKITSLGVCPTDHQDRIVAEATEHFVTLERKGEGLSLAAIRADGSLIEEVALGLP